MKNNEKIYAVRNVRLCTKDCLCLYVCPTGATDTETGQIDCEKCIGCKVCMDACPSHAISMVPKSMPPQQKKTKSVVASLHKLAKSKTKREQVALRLEKSLEDPLDRKFMKAIAKSNRLMAEDIFRESGFMLPQSKSAQKFLKGMLENPEEDFPADVVEKLLEKIKVNE